MTWKWRWEDHLTQVLLPKPAEVVQEACQVLEKHGYPLKKKLKSELYYSSTLCQVMFRVLPYANLQSGWSYRNRVVISQSGTPLLRTRHRYRQ